MNLSTVIANVPRIGPAYQKRLWKLGIKTVRDLLFHFPHRYEDFSNIKPISQLAIGERACVQGEILDIQNSRTFRRRLFLTEAIVKDKTGAIKAVWFNQPYLLRALKQGTTVCLAGKVAMDQTGVYFSNPAYEKVGDVSPNLLNPLTHTGRLVPVYPETEGLSSRWLRWLLKPLLTEFRDKILEPLPEKIIQEHNLLPINKAIWQIHFPSSLDLAEKAMNRFAFEELFNISVFALRQRLKMAQQKSAPIPLTLALAQKFTASLPFTLTDAQKKAAWQILKDLEKPRPMNRLLEGDVGSGKTVVAVMAALNTAKAGFQVGFMAPTEILAKQHFKEVSRLLSGFGLNIGLLTGKQDKFISKKLPKELIEISRAKLLDKTKKGEIDILIGTHALIQDKVKFGRLGLVILDEQHRFGVEQRAKLTRNANNTNSYELRENERERYIKKSHLDIRCPNGSFVPHLLSMTATPIPRTLALTIYGDLDLSLIDELPKGRKKIITKVVAPANRQKAYEFIRSQVKKGRQVFVICPRIESQNSKLTKGHPDHPNCHSERSPVRNLRFLTERSEESHNPTDKDGRDSSALPQNDNERPQNDNERAQNDKAKKQILSWAEVKAVEEEYEKLSQKVFPELKIGMLHGRLAAKEKEKIMRDFKSKKIHILVSTSVVEVGIDVPNASVMLIEGAERFGLAQLHQFRGRVGRAEHQSFCFLFTDSPAKKTRQRLNALINCENGFELAEKDLQIRGPGDFSGTRQWGIPDLAMNSLKDLKLVEKTRQAAKEILTEDPGLKNYPLLAERLKKFGERVHLE